MRLLNFLSRARKGAEAEALTNDVEVKAPLIEDRCPLHVIADDAELRVENSAVMVDGHRVLLREISHISLHGGARITARCLQALCQNDIPLIIHARGGYPLGWTVTATGSPANRRAQYAAADDPNLRLGIAQQIVDAKLRMTLRLARRRDAPKNVLRGLERARNRVRRTKTIQELLGHEGRAAADWFGCWPPLLRAGGAADGFSGRTRRPPRDAVNAAISYGYAVMVGSCAVAAQATGLDPAVGFLHAERAGRPALALDLAEPLRPAIVDAAILAGLNARELRGEHFVGTASSVHLTDDGRRVVLNLLERRLATGFRAKGCDFTWRDAAASHAQHIRRMIRHRAPAPFVLMK
jgi:CRISPR-associated protein Cas1